jgi:uncharacterized protein YhbP (UPF0306 family)
MDNQELKQIVKQFLSERRVMVLATSDSEFPWICNVYYVVDEELNFYFLSYSHTIHVKQMLENDKVAVTVADSDQIPENDKRAVQVGGKIERVSDVEKIKWFIDNWTKTPEKYPADELAVDEKRAVYRVTPKKFKYFDTKMFPDGEHCQFINF